MTRHSLKILAAVILVAIAQGCGKKDPSVATKPWNLVWSDEFDYNGLPDSQKWKNEVGYIRNNELQYYTNQRIENAIASNGMLHIIGKKEAYQGAAYTSASITTQRAYSFTYGKVEASMRLPIGQGLWPAFWLLGQNINQVGWPKCGEIDIMEHINSTNTIYGTMHWDNGGHMQQGSSIGLDPTQFHTYSIQWSTDSIMWFVDGNNYFRKSIQNGVNGTEEFQRPFYIILNLANGGDWPGAPDAGTAFPDTVMVDYVRVYQRK